MVTIIIQFKRVFFLGDVMELRPIFHHQRGLHTGGAGWVLPVGKDTRTLPEESALAYTE